MAQPKSAWLQTFLMKAYFVLTVPISILFILNSSRIHPSYRMTLFKKYLLGFRMFRTKLRVPSGSSYRAHLAMALKILETPPEVPGCIIECGSWKGGSSVNLSLVCQIVGRKLKVYDSFEGLPQAKEGDRFGKYYQKGEYAGALEEVRANIRRYGALDSCEFVKGWFSDTLPAMNEPILLAYLDVDLEDSLHTCVKYIWPHLVEHGYIFTDECESTDYVALFYSETWWRKYFNRTPPGLIGAGTGLPLGEFYIGPYDQKDEHPMQHGSTGAYTFKSSSGYWSYYPD